MSDEKKRDDKPDWRAAALELGVDPDEPDDWRYHGELILKQAVLDSFKYHQPTPAQVERIGTVRKAHIELAKVIMRATKVGPDQSAALRKLHECMMTVNKSIVCEVETG